jgi:hypothetical protein
LEAINTTHIEVRYTAPVLSIFIVYASTSGHTEYVVNVLSDALKQKKIAHARTIIAKLITRAKALPLLLSINKIV